MVVISINKSVPLRQCVRNFLSSNPRHHDIPMTNFNVGEMKELICARYDERDLTLSPLDIPDTFVNILVR